MATLDPALLRSGALGNRYLEAVAILAVAWLGARLARWLLGRVLPRLTRHTRTDLDDHLLELLRRPVQESVLLAGLALATLHLDLPLRPERITLALLATLAVLIWLAFALRTITLLLPALAAVPERFRLIDTRTLPLFSNLARVLLVGAAAYLLFVAWRIDVTPWLASAGIVGIAVGFAAKDTLANLFAGVFISVDAPYKLGDYIVLDSGERGRVTNVGIRSTRLLTRDDVEITIPNAVIANAKIVNESGGPWEKERVRIPLSVAYGSDVDQVREVLLAVAAGKEHVCPEPEPRVRFRAFGDSGLLFELLCWIDEPALRGRLVDALNTAIYKAFGEAGIEIPYPKRDVYLHRPPRRPDQA